MTHGAKPKSAIAFARPDALNMSLITYENVSQLRRSESECRVDSRTPPAFVRGELPQKPAKNLCRRACPNQELILKRSSVSAYRQMRRV